MRKTCALIQKMEIMCQEFSAVLPADLYLREILAAGPTMTYFLPHFLRQVMPNRSVTNVVCKLMGLTLQRLTIAPALPKGSCFHTRSSSLGSLKENDNVSIKVHSSLLVVVCKP